MLQEKTRAAGKGACCKKRRVHGVLHVVNSPPGTVTTVHIERTMAAETNPLRLFVAMPYSKFGDNARWTNPADVKEFYERVRADLQTKLERKVVLEIEEERGEAGVIHETMFRAAYEADMFIADVSGANANVLFELGVRFSVRRSVTVLTSQDEGTLFNINSVRIVRYADRPDRYPIQEIVAMLKHGIEHPEHCDSPILDLLKLHVDSRERWFRVSGERVKQLLDAADNCDDPEAALDYVKQAVHDDPSSTEARLSLARLYRQRQDYGSALSAVKKAINYCPKVWQLYQEQGLILDRMAAAGSDCLDEAITSFQSALTLHGGDADVHCCLGGVYRRRALRPENPKRDVDLQEARDHYEKAVGLERHNSYAGINLLRLLLLNQKSESSNSTVPSYIQRMYHLCAFEVADAEVQATTHSDEGSQHCWKLFDYGDMLIFSEEGDEALKTYQRAIAMVPAISRAETLLSPIRTWNELIEAKTLKSEVRVAASSVLEALENARQ